jgi:hypothetical protein
MEELPSLFATLQRLGEDPTSGVVLQPPAYDRAVRRMQELVRVASHEAMRNDAMPDDFVDFLRLANGARIKDAWVSPTSDVGRELRDPGWTCVVVGGVGTDAECEYDWRDRRYHLVRLTPKRERLGSYATFAELLAAMMLGQELL